MIRITEHRLPLDHPPAALKTAAAQRLGVPEHALATLHVHKRSHDARKKQALTFIYSVDLELEGGADAEARLLARFADDPYARSVNVGKCCHADMWPVVQQAVFAVTAKWLWR